MECEDSWGSCLTCETGYYISNNKCTYCEDFMPGCLACSNSSVCFSCQVAFKYNGTNLQCSDCHETCATCDEFYDECLTCNANQYRELDGTDCVCQAGYYDVQPSSYTCSLCSGDLDYCYLCDNNTVCLECEPHYYFVTNGGIKECEACNQYC